MPKIPQTNPFKLKKSQAAKLSLLKTDFPPENKEMNDILAVMEKLLHWAAIIESSDDAIISKSAEGYITSWNRGAQKLYGYSQEEIIGKPVSVLMPPEKEDDFPLIMSQLLTGKRVEHYETKRKTKDGKIIDVSITVSPIKNSQGKVIGASKIARDISDRVEYEKRRDEFVSNASHELRTPITSQKVFGELLEKLIDKNGHQEYKKYVQKINKQTRKLEKLINDLLELSRIQTGRLSLELQPVEIDSLITEVVDDLQKILQHQVSVECTSKAKVLADSDLINQVLVNLLTNAAKYSPRAKEIRIACQKQANSVIISVQDSGIGIAPEFHEKIFERFFRVSTIDAKSFPGMGIGLNFCKEVITQHKGKIWVESDLKKGSTFFISLPLAK